MDLTWYMFVNRRNKNNLKSVVSQFLFWPPDGGVSRVYNSWADGIIHELKHMALLCLTVCLSTADVSRMAVSGWRQNCHRSHFKHVSHRHAWVSRPTLTVLHPAFLHLVPCITVWLSAEINIMESGSLMIVEKIKKKKSLQSTLCTTNTVRM